MLVGNKQQFAIELEILDVVDDWVFGTFLFWVEGLPIGDDKDKSVDLNGCVNWLRELIVNPKNRFELGLYDLEKSQVYDQLCNSVLIGDGNQHAEERYANIFSRFHISHIGMSSFDNITIVLVENGDGDARFVWKQDNQKIEEGVVKLSSFNQVVADAIAYYEKARLLS